MAIPLLLFYVVTYTIGFFFQAAIVAGASERMNGGDPTVGSALRSASKRFGPLLLWGVIAGTVGLIIRSIEEKSELAGKIVMGLLGVAWSLATYFMVPVLVMEDEPVGSAFKRSWNLFKRRLDAHDGSAWRFRELSPWALGVSKVGGRTPSSALGSPGPGRPKAR